MKKIEIINLVLGSHLIRQYSWQRYSTSFIASIIFNYEVQNPTIDVILYPLCMHDFCNSAIEFKFCGCSAFQFFLYFVCLFLCLFDGLVSGILSFNDLQCWMRKEEKKTRRKYWDENQCLVNVMNEEWENRAKMPIWRHAWTCTHQPIDIYQQQFEWLLSQTAVTMCVCAF